MDYSSCKNLHRLLLHAVVLLCCFSLVACTLNTIWTLENNCTWAGQSVSLKASHRYAVFVVSDDDPRSNFSTIPLSAAMWKAIGWVPLFVVERVNGEGKQDWKEMMKMSSFVAALGGILIYLPERSLDPKDTTAGTRLHAATIAAALLRVEQEDTRMLVPWGDALAWSLLSKRIKPSDLIDGAHHDNNNLAHALRELADKVGRPYGIEGTAKAWRDALLSLHSSHLRDVSFTRGMTALLSPSSPSRIKEGAILSKAIRYTTNSSSTQQERHPPGHPTTATKQQASRYSVYGYDRVREHLLPSNPSHVRLLDVFYHRRHPPRVFWFVVTHRPQKQEEDVSRIEGCMDTWLDEDVHIITRLALNHSRVLPILKPGIDTLPSHRQTIKFFSVWDYIYRELLNEYDWFVKVDDDTYLRKDYTLWDIIKEDHRDGTPQRRGELFCQDNPNLLPFPLIPSTPNGNCYCTGPAYALNREALSVLGEHIETCKAEFKKLKYEDMAIGLCMNKHGIPPCNGHSLFINTLNNRTMDDEAQQQWMWYHKATPTTMKRLRLCDSFGIFG